MLSIHLSSPGARTAAYPDLPGSRTGAQGTGRGPVWVPDLWRGRDVEKVGPTLGPATVTAGFPRSNGGMSSGSSATTLALEDAGWTVLRFWETDVLRDPLSIARQVLDAVRTHRPTVPGLLPSSTRDHEGQLGGHEGRIARRSQGARLACGSPAGLRARSTRCVRARASRDFGSQ